MIAVDNEHAEELLYFSSTSVFDEGQCLRFRDLNYFQAIADARRMGFDYQIQRALQHSHMEELTAYQSVFFVDYRDGGCVLLAFSLILYCSRRRGY